MQRILSFGEILLRLSPDSDGAWLANNKMTVYVGGAEANVAMNLGHWNVPVDYFSVFPDNFLSDHILGILKSRNVGIERSLRRGSKIGMYILPVGQELKNAGVIYDRHQSSFSLLGPGEINWRDVLQGIDWLHLSAISPALTPQTSELCLELLQAAADAGVQVSLDLNYREKLWKYGKRPDEIMPSLIALSDLVMGNVWAIQRMTGIVPSTDLSKLQTDDAFIQASQELSMELMRLSPRCRMVANTFRFENNGGIRYFGTFMKDNEFVCSRSYSTAHVVDKVGTGDCFMAGLLYGLHHGFEIRQCVEFAASAAFRKLFVSGDTTTDSAADILATIEHGKS
jgi:2-dehydro-3-deoxygluconokinase